MSFPASLTTRTVNGRFVTYPDGVAAKGSARIVLEDFMQGPTDDAFVAPFDKTIEFDSNGVISVVLPSNNDPQWTPGTYRIVLTVGNKVHRQKFTVPYDATTPIDLADILNLPVPTPGESYVVLASKGVAGGVASLGLDGKVPASQLPVGSGGESGPVSWLDLTDKPATFPPSPHIHPTSDVGLGNVDNTSDANKPVSTAQQTALNQKANLASPTFTGTVSGVTAAMVGLGNVNNTADSAKPVSTAQQNALDLKAPLASPALTGTPTAPTATAGANTTQVATTAFVTAAIAADTPKVLVLSAAAPIPGGTPAGTVIVRTTT